MTPRIGSIGHVGVFVEDVERSLAFYRDLLGLTLTDADEKAGMYFLSARPAYEQLADVIGFYHKMKDAGVEFDRIVSHGNAIGIYFFDPDHNRCEVYWPTGLYAHQTYLAPIDLERPADELIAEVRAHVAKYGATGFVDPSLLRN